MIALAPLLALAGLAVDPAPVAPAPVDPGPAAPRSATPARPAEGLADEVTQFQLDNGWTFLLLPRRGAPVVSFETYIDVGSVNERPGITGMAHMFEHMAFKGSDRIGTKDWAAERSRSRRSSRPTPR